MEAIINSNQEAHTRVLPGRVRRVLAILAVGVASANLVGCAAQEASDQERYGGYQIDTGYPYGEVTITACEGAELLDDPQTGEVLTTLNDITMGAAQEGGCVSLTVNDAWGFVRENGARRQVFVGFLSNYLSLVAPEADIDREPGEIIWIEINTNAATAEQNGHYLGG